MPKNAKYLQNELIKRMIFVLITITLIFSIGFPTRVKADSGNSFASILDQRMPELFAKYGVPGAVVSYIKDGDVIWTQAYGMANVANGKPMSTDMIFNFGSTGKVLTAWGVMRLVELGKVDLDAPVNQYLKRWQIQSTDFNAADITVRRLLSHTAGLSISGFNDYSPRRIQPTLVQMLEGQNQTDGKLVVFQKPGKGFQYSGAGFALLQMMIEDVSGEPFAQFMEREVTGPLSMSSLHWTWTPELTASAPTPYGPQQEQLEYRQLAAQAVGSEIATVPDYARFVAAAVSGPKNEPAGRGVLKPGTIAEMITIQPGTTESGLAYGVTDQNDGKLLQHFGANNGWTAFFTIDTNLREGLVLANNSSNGFPFNAAVQNLWRAYIKNGSSSAFEPEIASNAIPTAGVLVLIIAALLLITLIICLVIFFVELKSHKRSRVGGFHFAGIFNLTFWVTVEAFWVYWFYTNLPLPFSPKFPDFWRIPQTDLVTGILVAWLVFSVVSLVFPKTKIQKEG